MRSLRNSRGQSLIEYVILVALVGVASIGMVRLLQSSVKVNLARIVNGLQGKSARAKHETLREDDTRKSDFGDFMNGAASRGSEE